jgi:hypothetical protein
MGLDITGLGSVFDFGSKVIDKIFPDKDAADKAKLEMMKLSQAGEFKEIEQDFELAKKQIEANIAEATKGGLMNQWRPAIGWVCVCAYAFNYLVMPLANWIVLFFNSTAPAIVALDTGELTTLLFGMLGIGGLRTFEKVKGVASK